MKENRKKKEARLKKAEERKNSTKKEHFNCI